MAWKIFGTRAKRLEDPSLLRGKANFIDDIQPTAVQCNNFPRIKYVWVDKKDGLLSGEKCRNSLLVPFINGTEPNTIPAVRSRCATKPERNTSDVMQKLRKVFEEG